MNRYLLWCGYVICTLCTGFFCLAIIKGPPNDIYFIIEGPYDGYFTEKVSQALLCSSLHDGIGRYLIVENHRFPVIRITL